MKLLTAILYSVILYYFGVTSYVWTVANAVYDEGVAANISLWAASFQSGSVTLSSDPTGKIASRATTFIRIGFCVLPLITLVLLYKWRWIRNRTVRECVAALLVLVVLGCALFGGVLYYKLGTTPGLAIWQILGVVLIGIITLLNCIVDRLRAER